MAILVKIDFHGETQILSNVTEIKKQLLNWGRVDGIYSYISTDCETILTDLAKGSCEFCSLIDILHKEKIRFTAIGNIDVKAYQESLINEINKQ